MKRIAYFVFLLGLFTVLLGSPAGAQTAPLPPDQSLGDYARKVHKDPSAPKSKPKVFDNDNLPKDDKLSIVGQPPSVAGSATSDSAAKSAPADTKDAAKPSTTNDEEAKKQAAWKAWQEKLAEQKRQIDLASRELDVVQREYQLRAAAMYADVGNRLRNSVDWDKQEAQYKQQIVDKQKAVEDAKQKLDEMEEEARKAGVPASMRD
ncbi:MAG: hypothetical protein WB660_04855 [Candidatus Sulfotelmatobacter sp.]